MRKLSDKQVRFVLTSNEPARELAARYNTSRTLIAEVRLGTRYKDVCPDIPRGRRRQKREKIEQNSGASCTKCTHCSGYESNKRLKYRCDLDIPEIREPGYGLRFAKQCIYYTPNEK